MKRILIIVSILLLTGCQSAEKNMETNFPVSNIMNEENNKVLDIDNNELENNDNLEISSDMYILSRMQFRNDTTQASKICEEVREWYTDFKAYPEANVEFENVENGFIKYTEIDRINAYLSSTFLPTSYKPNGELEYESATYYVTIINEGTSNDKIVIAIGPDSFQKVPEGDKTFDTIFSMKDEEIGNITYDGTGSGIIYIEQ